MANRTKTMDDSRTRVLADPRRAPGNPRKTIRPAAPDAAEAAGDGSAGVEAFLRALRHPLKKEIEAVRRAVLGADRSIREGMKWNAPSFRTTEWFATLGLRAKDRLLVVLHKGAKAKDGATKAMAVADPLGLLQWPARDRAVATLVAGKDFGAQLRALARIVREWVRRM